MRFDDYFKLTPQQREEAYERLSPTARGILIGESNAALAASRKAIADHYAAAYADTDFIRAAEREGITVQHYVHQQIGAPGASARPHIDDDDNPALNQPRAALK